MEKITREELEKWSKEELIQFVLLRNDDAKDYSNNLKKGYGRGYGRGYAIRPTETKIEMDSK